MNAKEILDSGEPANHRGDPCRGVSRECADRAVEAAVLAAKQWTDADMPLPEDDAIQAVHPTRSGRHALYAEAMRFVGAKHSKYALVDLVNWLLAEKEVAVLVEREACAVLCDLEAPHSLKARELASAIRARGGR